MQFLISLILSACISAALYQFIVPAVSRGAVAFQPVSVGHKLLFGVALSFASQLALFVLTVLASLTLVPLFAMVAGAAASGGVAVLVFSIALMVTLLQLANWFATMALGRFMPNVIRVDSNSAAFRAALVPTLLTAVFYAASLFLQAPVAFQG